MTLQQRSRNAGISLDWSRASWPNGLEPSLDSLFQVSGIKCAELLSCHEPCRTFAGDTGRAGPSFDGSVRPPGE